MDDDGGEAMTDRHGGQTATVGGTMGYSLCEISTFVGSKNPFINASARQITRKEKERERRRLISVRSRWRWLARIAAKDVATVSEKKLGQS